MPSHFRKRTFAELSEETTTRHGQLPLVLFLHNIRSQYNVGALLRTADAVGIEKVIFSGYTPTPEQSGVKKTALRGGADMCWEQVQDPVAFLRAYKSTGYTIYALEQCHESKKHTDVEYTFPAVLILGEEVEGVSDLLLQHVDQAIEIPMFGRGHSLNVSVAGGIVMYTFLQHRVLS